MQEFHKYPEIKLGNESRMTDFKTRHSGLNTGKARILSAANKKIAAAQFRNQPAMSSS